MSLLGHADFRSGGATLDLASPADVAAFLGSFPPGSFEAVGFLDDAVVAYGGIYPLPGWQKHTGALTLCVHHAFQRRGIGAAVLVCLINTARVIMGLHRLQLTVFVDNAPAIALYRRFGFATEGRITDFVERPGGFVDAYLMALVGPRVSTMGRTAAVASFAIRSTLSAAGQAKDERTAALRLPVAERRSRPGAASNSVRGPA